MKEFKEHYFNGQIQCHYWENEKGKAEGEYKSWHFNGRILQHCFYKNGVLQGEYKSWHKNGHLVEHYFFHNNKIVDIAEYVADVNNITEEEYFLLQMTFGYFPVIKYNGTQQ